MANPDVRRDTEAPEPSIETRGASPEIVYLPESFDLGAFPSEEPVEPTVASAPALQEVAVGAVSAAGEPVAEPTPVASEVTPEEPPAVATFSSTGPSLYSAEPTPVLEFSVRPSAAKPADLDLITDASEPLTLLQVLDSGGHVSWREAVAIVHQLCVQLKDVPSHAPVLIEPGSIQIAASGQLRLLSNQQGGDPLVIQLGRLLGSMLSMESVPAELRLLVSQATFELAIFESVEHFSQALAKLSGPSDSDCVKAAFGRAAHQCAAEDRIVIAAATSSYACPSARSCRNQRNGTTKRLRSARP